MLIPRPSALKSAAVSLALGMAALAAQAQTFNATTMPVPVPDGTGTGTCATPGTVDIPIVVAGVTGNLSAISVSLSMESPWVADGIAVLLAPGGAPSQPLFGRIGVSTGTPDGDTSNFDGVYQFVDPTVSANHIWTAAAGVDGATAVPPGTYATTQIGSHTQPGPAATIPFLATFSGLTPAQINGTWVVRMSDCANLDRLTVNAASLTLVAAAAPAPVPTLGEWGLLLTGLLAAGLGASRLRRRG